MSHLIVTNGLSGVETLRLAGIPGELMSWDDVLHDGPVRGALAPSEYRKSRARFLGGLAGADQVEERLKQRDERLHGYTGVIVLWFEHDLYDQLQLAEIVSRLDPAREVLLVPQDTYIAHSRAAALQQSWTNRAPLSHDQRRQAETVWRTFTSERPDLISEPIAQDALPFMPSALLRWCAMFPDRRAGLSRTERLVLELCANGPMPGGRLFGSTQAAEEAVFRGDWSFWRLLDGLKGLVVAQGDGAHHERSWQCTALGLSVLRGEVDRLEAVGLDRWFGGTRVTPQNDWRWDGERLRRG
ncbi:MAG: hypothetical protein JJ896_06730 [Rhodothermales bacterium]|nr:hypothetical protein [Rhodothermales bacterium]MBO6779331.1 hypothetical protein [Rhodothermales bacterium]